MKNYIVVAVLLHGIFSVSASAQSKEPVSKEPVTLKGHQLGETFAEFVAKEPEVQTSLNECEKKEGYSITAVLCKQDVKFAQNVLSFRDRTDHFSLSAPGVTPSVLAHFDGGKLVLIGASLKGEYEDIVAEIARRTGVSPTEAKDGVERTASWRTTDILIRVTANSSDNTRTVTMLTPAEEETEIKLRKAAQKKVLD